MQYLILPRDGDTPCDKLVVKVIVGGVEVHAFDSGELLDVQHIFAVDSSRLPEKKKEKRRMMEKHEATATWMKKDFKSALIYGYTRRSLVRLHVPEIPSTLLFSVWSKCPDDLK